MHIRPFAPIEYTDAFTGNIGDTLNSHNLHSGKGIQIVKNSSGTIISLTDETVRDRMVYAGTYSFSNEYKIGDVVYVDPLIEYKNQNNTTIPLDVSGSAFTGSAICGGLFVCVNEVPNGNMTREFLTASIPYYESGGVTVSSELADSHRHYEYNAYYPIYPIWDGPTYTEWVTTSDGYDTVANQIYWYPLSPMIVSKICVGESEQTVYINGVVSGSAFDIDRLPYI